MGVSCSGEAHDAEPLPDPQQRVQEMSCPDDNPSFELLSGRYRRRQVASRQRRIQCPPQPPPPVAEAHRTAAKTPEKTPSPPPVSRSNSSLSLDAHLRTSTCGSSSSFEADEPPKASETGADGSSGTPPARSPPPAPRGGHPVIFGVAFASNDGYAQTKQVKPPMS